MNEPHCIVSSTDVNSVGVLTMQFIVKGYF